MSRLPRFDPGAPVIAIDAGNTTTSLATWKDGGLLTPLSVGTGDMNGFREAFAAHVGAMSPRRPVAVAMASVVPEATKWIRNFVSDELNLVALVVGDTLPLPLEVDVEDARAIGADRVCAAAATYATLGTACIVVDFGSAVTVDLIDDAGVLKGGAILPGLTMQLRALHEFTAALPHVGVAFPELPYGRNTTEAMQTGVCRGVAGAVRGLVEAYATALNRWPQVVATGGDLEVLAPHCDYLDSTVRDLTLRGVGLAYSKHLASQGV